MKAEIIGRALGGRRFRGGWMAGCPAHDDREPSFSIREADHGDVLVRCHAGCEQVQVIAALRARGLWDQKGRRHGHLIHPLPWKASNHRSDRDDKRTELALTIWERETATPASRPRRCAPSSETIEEQIRNGVADLTLNQAAALS